MRNDAFFQPVSALEVPRFAGMPSFMRLPHLTMQSAELVNAFALPGGYTYVTRGLLALANSEAELAGVIGHEIGHVTARHGARRHTTAVGASILGTVIGNVLTNSTGINPNVAGDLINFGGSALLAGYSRSQEYEADDIQQNSGEQHEAGQHHRDRHDQMNRKPVGQPVTGKTNGGNRNAEKNDSLSGFADRQAHNAVHMQCRPVQSAAF